MKLYIGSCDLGTNQDELRNWIKIYGKDIIFIPHYQSEVQGRTICGWYYYKFRWISYKKSIGVY